MQRKILVVGSLNTDQVIQVPRLPVFGETLLATRSHTFPGGKGGNQAVAMARLGASVLMAGCVGADAAGKQLVAALHHEQIDTSLVVVEQEKSSGFACIFLSPAGENAIIVAAEANSCVGVDEEQRAKTAALVMQVQAVVLQLEIPLATVQVLIEVGYKAGVPVILNAAPAYALPQEVLTRVAVLIVNESEASMLSGVPIVSVEDAQHAGIILQNNGSSVVVITLGARGALLITKDASGQRVLLREHAPSVHVVDTTAAGDCFVGALTVALTEGKGYKEALQFAVAASALKVTKIGAQSGLPTKQEVLASLESFKSA